MVIFSSYVQLPEGSKPGGRLLLNIRRMGLPTQKKNMVFAQSRVSEVMQIPSRLHGCFNTKIFGHPWLGWSLGVPPLISETSVFFPRMQKFLSPLFLLWAPSGHVELLEIQQWPTCLIETSICKWECSLPANFFCVSHHQVCGQHVHLIKLNNIKNVVGPRNKSL